MKTRFQSSHPCQSPYLPLESAYSIGIRKELREIEFISGTFHTHSNRTVVKITHDIRTMPFAVNPLLYNFIHGGTRRLNHIHGYIFRKADHSRQLLLSLSRVLIELIMTDFSHLGLLH